MKLTLALLFLIGVAVVVEAGNPVEDETPDIDSEGTKEDVGVDDNELDASEYEDENPDEDQDESNESEDEPEDNALLDDEPRQDAQETENDPEKRAVIRNRCTTTHRGRITTKRCCKICLKKRCYKRKCGRKCKFLVFGCKRRCWRERSTCYKCSSCRITESRKG